MNLSWRPGPARRRCTWCPGIIWSCSGATKAWRSKACWCRGSIWRTHRCQSSTLRLTESIMALLASPTGLPVLGLNVCRSLSPSRPPRPCRLCWCGSPWTWRCWACCHVVLTGAYMAVGLRSWGGNTVNKGPKRFVSYQKRNGCFGGEFPFSHGHTWTGAFFFIIRLQNKARTVT